MFTVFFDSRCHRRARHVLTHSFPTRRSSDLAGAGTDRTGALVRFDLRGDELQQRGLARAVAPDQRQPIPLPDENVEIAEKPVGALRQAEIFEGKDGSRHRSEEHTSELQSLMRISYAVFCLKKKTTKNNTSMKI